MDTWVGGARTWADVTSSVEWPQQQSKGRIDMLLINFIICPNRRFIAETDLKVKIGAEGPILTPIRGCTAPQDMPLVHP